MNSEQYAHFNEAYKGTPPWDIGEPQPEIVRLLETGEIRGPVLDAGCGTGENALFLAQKGIEVRGFDLSIRAIEKARQKAKARGLEVAFEVADALQLRKPVEPFQTVIDSGLFHVFPDADRTTYVENLSEIIAVNGTYYVLCFSEHEPPGEGPKRVTQDEIRDAFRSGWSVNWIRPAILKTNPEFFGGGARGWLASISKK